MHTRKGFLTTVNENLLHRYLGLDTKGLWFRRKANRFSCDTHFIFTINHNLLGPVSKRLICCNYSIPNLPQYSYIVRGKYSAVTIICQVNKQFDIFSLLVIILDCSSHHIPIFTNSAKVVVLFIYKWIILTGFSLVNTCIANFSAMSTNTLYIFLFPDKTMSLLLQLLVTCSLHPTCFGSICLCS